MRLTSFSLLAVVALVALCSCCALSPAVAQSLPEIVPHRVDGFPLGGPMSAPIVVDAFLDFACPYCAAAWPTLKQLIKHYGNNLHFRFHTFPLPYHFNGFLLAHGAHVCVDSQFVPTIESYADLVFAKQDAFGGGVTANTTSSDVQKQLATLLARNKLAPSVDAFEQGMTNSTTKMEAVLSWVYGASRNVVGTPTFHVNGVAVSQTDSLADWQALLDPLLKPQLKRW